ncbi:TetR/AcrR family transcriptional regulator [Taibaiella chishuiensis]|uniref:TetR family transcriptional regulator n=1 Tax=Taibaiella chishuiensis TaxID=1434707 RepID=A0A2P8D2T1_9BACT|nr:TetR/AcrR family transcriptional regulator [Taibaiella chishuiensis]PSK91538.1 TetR family transcriptional regulator [Taibaiella chishuiensis]
MKGRPNIHDDQELVLKAQEVFWQRGYHATSLSDLSTATGAGAGSLYNTFKGGKKELFRKALQQRSADLLTFKQKLEQSENQVAPIKQFFLDIADADPITHQKGCIVVNTLTEMTCVDEDLKQEAAEILTETEKLYKQAIAHAQKHGYIASKTPADTLAKYLVTFWCGLNALRRIYPDKKVLKRQIALQLQVLD